MRKYLEAISLGALALLIWITWRALHGPDPLPARIPTHFDLAGNPNGWGSPSSLQIFAFAGVAIYLFITVVARFPSVFNYPVRVTESNRNRLQGMALDMIAWLKAELICLFTWIQWAIVEAARHSHNSLSPAQGAVSVLIIWATIIWYFIAMRRAARPGSSS
jgi:uncharacterized membrane protein